jgi:hypothetical protein
MGMKASGHTESTPYFAILLLDSKDALEIFDSLKGEITS